VRWLNDPALVQRTPMVTVFLLEGANISQLWRMWTEHSALGQSVQGWILVNLALVLWLNFYRVCLPPGQRRWAIVSTGIGWCLNMAVILSVLYFRAAGKA
jgi:uncharacterized membrane protein YbaN (DUF454 family)